MTPNGGHDFLLITSPTETLHCQQEGEGHPARLIGTGDAGFQI
ncbi:hypothetical protein HMPREF9620_01928 [Cutibacterium acnes HL037PA1]|nr:hypothetical protein HMPREF9620_01928 [Cutibacterium acnes HL037PA1]